MADDVLVEKVLRAVELVPPGRVVSYGTIGRLVGCGARYVGTVMRHHGTAVTWWRVTNVRGDLPPGLLAEARERWAAEGIPLRRDGRGCDYATCQVDLGEWAAAWERDVADLRCGL